MSKAYNEKELFDTLRSIPEELNLSEIETMIGKISAGQITPSIKGSLDHFFTFKTIIMTSIPVAIASVAMIYFFGFNPNDTLSITDNSTENIELTSPVEDVKIDLNKLTQVEKKSTIEDKPLVSFSTLAPMDIKLFSDEKGEAALQTSNMDLSPISDTVYQSSEITSKDANPENSINHFEKFNSNKFPEVVPELSGKEMRKYKNSLLKNLVKDGLIQSKKDIVNLQLRENEIILNTKKLNDDYFLKYRNLTSRIGYGPEREIRISPEYILLGDFTKEGFIGSGKGRFSEKLRSSEGNFFFDNSDFENFFDEFENQEEEIELNEIFEGDPEEEKREKQEDELQEFAIRTAAVYKPRNTKKTIFSVNLKNDSPEILHSDLYDALFQDKFIENKKQLVLIEIPEQFIYINGEKLTSELELKYQQILSGYNIKGRSNRQIRMSEYIIMVGDFQIGEFTGTIGYFDE